ICIAPSAVQPIAAVHAGVGAKRRPGCLLPFALCLLPFAFPRYRPPLMSPWWALVALAIFLIGLTKSGFGAGAGLMIVPMTAIAMRHTPFGAEAALPLLLPLLLLGDTIAIA